MVCLSKSRAHTVIFIAEGGVRGHHDTNAMKMLPLGGKGNVDFH